MARVGTDPIKIQAALDRLAKDRDLIENLGYHKPWAHATLDRLCAEVLKELEAPVGLGGR